MINTQPLINKICQKIGSGGLSDIEICQTSNALAILSNPVKSVQSINDLPLASENTGILIYVNDENRYYTAFDGVWVNNIDSEAFVYSSSVLGWGGAFRGRIGDNTLEDRSSPVSTVGEIGNWCQVSSGRTHTLGLSTNGTIWAWGDNECGRLGDGTVLIRRQPVQVIGGFTDWCGVAAGTLNSLGIRQNGTLWAWGRNYCSRLGNNSTIDRCSPVQVIGGFTDWRQICINQHNMGLRSNGTLWAWGTNADGQMGDGTSIQRSSPVQVIGGINDWCQFSAGTFQTLAVRRNGTAWSWGSNTCGQLGDYTTVTKSSPVQVVGGFTDWVQVSQGCRHSLGLRLDGSAWAWGQNTNGRLGDNTTVTKSSPVSVVGGFADWCQLSAGGYHSLGLRTNGTLWSWGLNTCGLLGSGTVVSRNQPGLVIGGLTNWCQISAGNVHNTGIVGRKTKGF